MNKYFWLNLLIVIILIASMVLFYTKIDNTDKDSILLEKIDELELKINSLQDKKDSIREVIDSTHVKIVTNEKHYQEVINTIISQPTTADYEYVSDYIRQYRSQNTSNNLR